MSRTTGDADVLELAVIGAGAAGTYVARTLQRARPDWRIGLFERSNRIGSRLRSVTVPGISHRIELGGMRFLTSHRRVASLVDEFRIPTHPFDATGGSERTFLRGRFGAGPGDPTSGTGYDLVDDERGRSAIELSRDAFQRVIPGAGELSPEQYARVRAIGNYLGRPVTDWSIGDAIGSVRSPGGARYVTEAFGYDSGSRAFNAGDAIEFLLGGAIRPPRPGRRTMAWTDCRASSQRTSVTPVGRSDFNTSCSRSRSRRASCDSGLAAARPRLLAGS